MKEIRKVYKHGRARFLQQMYQGECLKNYEGRCVILLYDPDRILQMQAYISKDDSSPSEFLGYVNMINAEGLGLSEDKLESGKFSLQELKSILAKVRSDMKASDESARHIRAIAARRNFIFQKKHLNLDITRV